MALDRLRWCRWIALAIVLIWATRPAAGAEVIRLSKSTWKDAAPHGKEADCIYGDWVLRNDHLVAVIADALPTRNANMTVRHVGGSVIDLTVRKPQSDQLSAYYPLGSHYNLSGPVEPEGKAAQQAIAAKGEVAALTFRGPATEGGSTGEVTYVLAGDARWLKIITRVTNTGDKPLEVKLEDAIRADKEFEFGQDEGLGLFWAYDPFWRQAYGAVVDDQNWRLAPEGLTLGGRPTLPIVKKNGEKPKLAAAKSVEVVRYLFPAPNSMEVLALARQLRGEKLGAVLFDVRDGEGPVAAANVDVKTSDGQAIANGRTGKKGLLRARLPQGKYQAVISGPGRGEQALDFTIGAKGKRKKQQVELATPGYVVAKITGTDGEPIPCKVSFAGRGDTPTPNFGPDSAVHGVRNLYYTENGAFRAPLAPGAYDVIVSHGPEFDAVFTTVEVKGGNETELAGQLKRSVNTSGWISGDFHSHSTPSGDNTASQRGRVLNLLAEHIEFAPCTEHNRLTVYDPHLKYFKAQTRMLTCPGMELTGRPLPINHQNAFPLKPHPRTQDGGAPLTDVDPVVQIERLAMWDHDSDKLVQINHPNIVQMVGDRDLNGSPDGGFEKMFSFVDVIEVHPLHRIFTRPDKLPSERERGNAIFNWLQLANLGYRLPGVVNTDAHWNFHGSGFLRNYIKSSTDDPVAAKVLDLVHECEHGHIMLTNGPFMEVSATAGDAKALVGDDLSAPGGKLKLAVRVERPNWLEVNRVQVFVNGRPEPKWNYTRRTHPAMFHPETVVFDEEVPLELASDAHVVVACIGEGEKLGPVMGPDHAADVPTAVGNPIFVDVDGDGFRPSGDMLGLPLPLEPGFKPSKPHHHHHHD